MLLFKVTLILLCYSVTFIESYVRSCSHVPLNISDMVTGIKIAPLPLGYVARNPTDTNLRIFFEYLSSFNNAPGAERLKIDVFEPAKSILEKKIRVKNPTQGILRVDRRCINGKLQNNNMGQIGCLYGCVVNTTCLGVTIPDKYLNACKTVTSSSSSSFTSGTVGAGEPNIDIVIIVNYMNCAENVLSHANSCFQESERDRPILGVMNVCSNIVAGSDIRTNINIIKHNLIHALGFTVDKYAFYRTAGGSPIVKRDSYGLPNLGVSTLGFYFSNNVFELIERDRSSISNNTKMPFISFVLPNVVQVAREHFNCYQLNEVDTEQGGDMSSAFSHFDEYLLNDEVMTALTNGAMDPLSKFTLALLKDTGWYDADYSSADEFVYGKNAGCTMPMKGCYAYMQEQINAGRSIDPFCDTVDGEILKCSSDRNYYERCVIRKYSYVEPTLQYFKSVKGLIKYDPSLYAGPEPFAEYCPINLIMDFYGTDGPNSDCKDVTNQGKSNTYTIVESSYGPNSMCFDTVFYRASIFGATCLKYEYDGNGLFYIVYYKNVPFNCTNGQEVILAANIYLKCHSPNSMLKNVYKPGGNDTITPSRNHSGIRLKTAYKYHIIWFIILRIIKP